MKIFKRILSVIVALSIVATIMSALPVANAYSGTTVTFDDEQVIPTDLGDNLLAGEVPIYLEYKAGNQSYVSKKLYPGNANLTNGVTKDSWHLTEQLFALDNEDGTRTFYDDGSAYCDVVFSLDKTTDINKICVINHPTRNLVTGKYEVYASRYRHELFYSENLIATVDNTANYNYRQLITCSGVTGVNFFAFKFIVPCKNSTQVATVNCYPRLSELCIYGTEAATKETFPHVGNESDKTDAVAYFDDTHLLDVSDGSRNFLKGKNTVDGGLTVTETTFEYYEKKIFSYVYESGYKQVTSTAGEKTDAQACITDGDGSTEWYSSTFRFITSEDVYNVGYTDYRNRNDGRADYDTDSDYDFYVDLLFDAGKSQDLGLFYIKHHSTEAIRTMHYRIYASNSSSMTEADIIADCYNYSGAQEHYITPKSGTTINARYYLIRVYDPCFNYAAPVLAGDNLYKNAYLRLYEVAAFSAESMAGDLYFDQEKFKFYGDDYLGGAKRDSTVKSVINGFTGVGEISVVDKNGNTKMPSEQIMPGDKAVVKTGYGTPKPVNLVLQSDLNNSGNHTVTDIVLAINAVLNGTTDNSLLAAGDADFSGSITVTDVVITTDVVMNGADNSADAATPIKATQKKGFATADTRKISVDTGTVLSEDFVGFGTNSFPSTLAADVQKKTGFNMVYNELNAKRLASIGLTVSRMWFQIDWLVTETCDYEDYADNPEENPDYINYLNGVYDFDSQWMKAVYEYVGMLQNAGTDVEINFGWKTASRIQNWFNTPCDDPRLGAPKDLDAYADAAASLIEELHKRGYDNVNAITFYNEPNLTGDFESGVTGDGHDDRVYWNQLVAKVSAEFQSRGLTKDKVEIWGPECSGMQYDGDTHRGWLQYQIENSADYVDVWTGHCYYKTSDFGNNYSSLFDSLTILAEMTNRNMIITEMQGFVSNPVYKNWISWNDSTTGYFIAVSNTGLRGNFTWMTVGGYLPDPLYMELYGDGSSAWEVPLTEERANTVQRVFYETALLTNYVPLGSQVLYTGWTGDDIRTSAYRLPDGNITVIVENNGYFSGAASEPGEGTEKNIEIKIGDGKTREFKRISYIGETQNIDANATVASPDKTITAKGGVISDTLGENYSIHVYTTAPAIKQVQIKNAKVTRHIAVGGTTQVIGELIDCEQSDEIVYSISEYTGSSSGTIGQDGVYISAADAKSGDMVAVRASLKSDPTTFAVAIIYID